MHNVQKQTKTVLHTIRSILFIFISSHSTTFFESNDLYCYDYGNIQMVINHAHHDNTFALWCYSPQNERSFTPLVHCHNQSQLTERMITYNDHTTAYTSSNLSRSLHVNRFVFCHLMVIFHQYGSCCIMIWQEVFYRMYMSSNSRQKPVSWLYMWLWLNIFSVSSYTLS
jgi:hypothetical protein